MSVTAMIPIYRASALDRAYLAVTFLVVFLVLCVSGSVLEIVGIPYGSPGGNPLSKLHPGTYVCVIGLMLNAARRGNPLGYFPEMTRRFPGITFFWVMILGLLLWVVLIQRTPFSGMFDTFLTPSMIFLLVADLTERQHVILTRCVHVFMTVNALLGIAEVAGSFHLFPVQMQGQSIEWDYRGTALLGHPLTNAISTGSYLLMLFFGADRSLTTGMRTAMVLLQVVASLAFGGRAAMVLSGLIMAVFIALYLLRVLSGATFNRWAAALVIVATPLVLGGLFVAYDLGAFDKLIERFTNDGGSAATRLSILRIFNSFTWYDLLMGPNPEVLVQKTFMEGTVAGIESFVYGFFLQYGMIISFIFFIGLAAYSFELWRIGSPIGAIILVYFYIVAAGAESLSSKSSILVILTVFYVTVEARPSIHDRLRPGTA